jgi:hypothetical protein
MNAVSATIRTYTQADFPIESPEVVVTSSAELGPRSLKRRPCGSIFVRGAGPRTVTVGLFFHPYVTILSEEYPELSFEATGRDVLRILRRRRLIPSLKRAVPYFAAGPNIVIGLDEPLIRQGVALSSTIDLRYRLLGGAPIRTRDEETLKRADNPDSE